MGILLLIIHKSGGLFILHVTGAADPRWSDWTEWTACSKTCSVGVQSRQRDCSTGFVQDCDGNHKEVEQCQLQACPGE